jgi:hypothetical protein
MLSHSAPGATPRPKTCQWQLEATALHQSKLKIDQTPSMLLVFAGNRPRKSSSTFQLAPMTEIPLSQIRLNIIADIIADIIAEQMHCASYTLFSLFVGY